jgi:hypothetical protein
MAKATRFLAIIPILLCLGCIFNDPWDTITTPSNFTRKVLIEETTSAEGSYCPDGAAIIEGLISAHPNVIIAAAYHDFDTMEISAPMDELTTALGGTMLYPSASINRTPYSGSTTPPIFMDSSNWNDAVDLLLPETAPCGLRLETSLSGNTATVTVSVGFHAPQSGDVRLSVLITEDNVIAEPQANFYTPTYGPDPIVGYPYMHVFRVFITPVSGEKMDVSGIGAGQGLEREHTFSIPSGSVAANINVIAAVHTYGPAAEDKRILNVQSVRLGSTKDWD